MKRLGKWVAFFLGGTLVGIAVLSLWILWRVDREWVEDKLGKPDFVSLRRTVRDLLKEKAVQHGAGLLNRLLIPQ